MTKYAPLPVGGRLAYAVKGHGPGILLVRPVGGSMLSWSHFADALAKRLKVIAFDARGTGGSSEAPMFVTTRELAREAIALLDHLALPKVHVFGLSLGGMVATWLAIDAPDRVERLVLASTLPRGLAISRAAVSKGLGLARALARTPAETEASLVTQILSGSFRKGHPEAVAELQRLARKRPATHRGLLTMLQAAARHDARARLHDIRAETMVLVGQRDPLITVSSQRKLLANIPHARFDVIDGAGHDVTAEAPDACAQHVLDFVG